MLSVLIRDGLTLDGKIAAVAGLHGELRFNYRPALPEDVHAFVNLPPKETFRGTVALVARHLVSWDLLDEREQEIPPTEAHVRRVYYSVLQQLANHVCGYVFSGDAEADLKNSASG